jgi:hypothetical protein
MMNTRNYVTTIATCSHPRVKEPVKMFHNMRESDDSHSAWGKRTCKMSENGKKNRLSREGYSTNCALY